jgi:hypothetical protein
MLLAGIIWGFGALGRGYLWDWSTVGKDLRLGRGGCGSETARDRLG